MVTVSLRSLVVSAVAALLVGCGASNQTVDTETMNRFVPAAKDRRAYFDKVGGDYSKLSPEDKEAYLKSFNGDEERAKRTWDLMANPPSQFGSGVPGSNPK